MTTNRRDNDSTFVNLHRQVVRSDAANRVHCQVFRLLSSKNAGSNIAAITGTRLQPTSVSLLQLQLQVVNPMSTNNSKL